MAINSINTNLASYSAQGNINRASDKAGASIARLSSGNRIVKASDDVAALSVGTVLRTSVSTLKQALLNTNQGSSLLQVADGALSQVVDILQRQKALTVQSSSGQLSDTERSFLNQEFQALSDEINRIAANTKFSSLNLLNGGLSGAQAVKTNTLNTVANTQSQTAGNVFAVAGALADGDQITVNGVTVTFTTSAAGTAAAAGKVTIGATTTQTAGNLAAFLNTSTDARLANLRFNNGTSTTPTANVTAVWGGGLLNGPYVLSASVVTGTNITAGTAANRTIATANTANGLSAGSVAAVGKVTGTILATGGSTAAAAGDAIQTLTTTAGEAIRNNADFIGKLGEGTLGTFQGVYSGTSDQALFTLKAGNITYSSVSTDITNAARVPLVFTGRDEFGTAIGGQFTLFLAGNGVPTFDSQDELNTITASINEALSGITFVQNRDVTSFVDNTTAFANGIQVGTTNGVTANIRSGDFSNVSIEDIRITAPTNGGTDAVFTAQINGERYISYSGIGNQIGTNTTIALQNLDDPTKSFTIQTGAGAIPTSATTTFDLSTQAAADAVAAMLRDSFGIDSNSSRLSFQVGGTAADSLGVKIDSVETSRLFRGESLSIATQAGATAAGAAVDIALNTVTAIRASVGALQSRFDFAAANVQTSIQNQDAARGALLDTDVTAESTAYATAQVQLQAGIAVLAQANQLPQNLLKLIS